MLSRRPRAKTGLRILTGYTIIDDPTTAPDGDDWELIGYTTPDHHPIDDPLVLALLDRFKRGVW